MWIALLMKGARRSIRGACDFAKKSSAVHDLIVIASKILDVILLEG
jgi:hypothetical protein